MKQRKFSCLILALLVLISCPVAVCAVETDESEPTEVFPVVQTDSDSGFSGLVRYTVNSNLGQISLQLPEGLDNTVLQLRDGYLYNVSGSTVYLYCDQFPTYTFSAARFSPVSYRTGSGYDTQQLAVYEVITYSASPDQMWNYLFYFLLILIVFLLFWRRSK